MQEVINGWIGLFLSGHLDLPVAPSAAIPSEEVRLLSTEANKQSIKMKPGNQMANLSPKQPALDAVYELLPADRRRLLIDFASFLSSGRGGANEAARDADSANIPDRMESNDRSIITELESIDQEDQADWPLADTSEKRRSGSGRGAHLDDHAATISGKGRKRA